MRGKVDREREREEKRRSGYKLLLHHVFIRYDLGRHNRGAEPSLETSHRIHKLKVNVRSISTQPAVVWRSEAVLLAPNETFLLKLIILLAKGCPAGEVAILLI